MTAGFNEVKRTLKKPRHRGNDHNQEIHRVIKKFPERSSIFSIYCNKELTILYIDDAKCDVSIYENNHWLFAITEYKTRFSYILYFSMDKTHIRYYILTRFKLGYTTKHIHGELCDAWEEGYVSYTLFLRSCTSRFLVV